MSDTIQIKNPSPLVKAVLALDAHYSDLMRLGERIEGFEMKSRFDFEQTERHLDHFAKAGKGVTDEVIVLAQHLMDVRGRAEAMAAKVAAKAQLLGERKSEEQLRMQEFAQLGEEVRELNLSLQELRRPEGAVLSDEERLQYREQLTRFDQQLQPLIEKARALKEHARETKMKELEQGADSLAQKLKTVSEKLMSI